ncbi:hypothetical protein TrCOL_g7469 [Triparma columacea]|uniref:DNA2/NAM7 helicase-like C-terminal domain-containing protein n=1 Tax=Triparma columacea TaxID=722753 RepID=A0A9W7L4L2_9STRA|nr:hypothetical protein TrCOL_g7469 [Triparma columacea]
MGQVLVTPPSNIAVDQLTEKIAETGLKVVVTNLMKGGVSGSDIGVITPYDGQKVYFHDYIRRTGSLSQSQYEGVEIVSVDSFQGRKKDNIIMTCVRSNDGAGIGFLADQRRLNVAITRARLGLVIIGNTRVLAKNILWAALLIQFRENKCLVEGSLQNLQETSIIIYRPRMKRREEATYKLTTLGRGSWKGAFNTRNFRRSSRPRDLRGGGGGEGVDDEGSIGGFAPLLTYRGDEESGWDDASLGSSRYSGSGRAPGSQGGESYRDYMDEGGEGDDDVDMTGT